MLSMKVILLKENNNGDDASSQSVKILPTIQELTSLTSRMEWPCPNPGCNQCFSRQSLFIRHIRVHPWFCNSSQLFYYCPGEGCIHNDNSITFKSIKYLKQHYTKIHCPKDFVCRMCEKSFGSQTYLNIHERICGTVFKCSCESAFSSLESLQTHARRKQHEFDLHKYQQIINSAKLNQKEKCNPKMLKPDSVLSLKEVKATCPILRKTTASNVPILPRPGPDARVILCKPTTSHSVDYGTQTAPILVRKRSATQHCQTESKSTKTTGTLTTPPSAVTPSKQSKRETFAQTKRVRISAETQTPVVTKRKRYTKKKQITTVTTQTTQQGIQSGVRSPLQAIDLSSTSTASKYSGMFESFDEVHSQTQTDPNPFFGWSPHNSFNYGIIDNYFEDKDEESNEMSEFRTSETQTSPSRKLLRFSNKNNPFTNPLDLEDFGTYLVETMDSETQTYYFEMEGLNKLFP